MPKRSRSHELEELSVARFNALLPAKWVSRAKLPDYGIDREVEIFDEQGNSTGLTFLVQLRATDSAQLRDRVVLETDELDYYRQLDLPVIVARYSSVSDSFFWQWDNTIRAGVRPKEGQSSVTYRFNQTDQWGEATSAAIRRTLEVRRALSAYPQGAAMPVRLDLSRLPAEMRYSTELAFGQAISQCSGALTRPRNSRLVEVDIVPEADFLAVRIDTITSVTFDLPSADAGLIVNSALYALVRLFLEKGLVRQAETIARAIVQRGASHHSEDLALAACQALAGDPAAMVELAILNGFHRQTVPYGAILFEISRSACALAAKDAASDRFFAAALEAAEENGPSSVAAVHYSIANHYRRPATYLRSLRHYNRARRLRPAYLQTGYFMQDLGGLLYEAGHPRCAADAYGVALDLCADPLLPFLLGDALFRAGALAEAQVQFEVVAAAHPPGVVVQEAALKQHVCAWLRREVGCDRLPLDRRAGCAAMRPDGGDDAEQFCAVLREIDGLNPLAHFNLGIHHRDAGRHRDAVLHFLTCAFIQPGDIEAWSNAAIGAFALGEAELLTPILAVAIERNGADAYDRFRADIAALGASAEALAELDSAAVSLIANAQASEPGAFTMRVLDGDRYEAFTIIDP